MLAGRVHDGAYPGSWLALSPCASARTTLFYRTRAHAQPSEVSLGLLAPISFVLCFVGPHRFRVHLPAPSLRTEGAADKVHLLREQDADIGRSKILMVFLSVNLSQSSTTSRLDAPTSAGQAPGEGAYDVSGRGRAGSSASGGGGGAGGGGGGGGSGRLLRLSPDMNGASALRERMGRE